MSQSFFIKCNCHFDFGIAVYMGIPGLPPHTNGQSRRRFVVNEHKIIVITLSRIKTSQKCSNYYHKGALQLVFACNIGNILH